MLRKTRTISFQRQASAISLFLLLLQVSTSIREVNGVHRVGPKPRGTYDYGAAVRQSLLFYQAQRSGYLSGMAPEVSWRKDSALNDRGQNGEDLVGGYYDAGDFCKFGFPLATSLTVLCWGMINYEDAYRRIGALEGAMDAVRWGTDWILKAHVAPSKLYAQVCNGTADHAWWGRPEDMTMARPSYYIDPSKPGSDLAGETAAALAAASKVFQNSDPSYSATLLSHAKQLFDFANQNRGIYSQSIPEADEFYHSTGFEDELVWGAAWLAKATGDQNYLNQAIDLFNEFNFGNGDGVFFWDKKHPGVNALLSELTGGADPYSQNVQNYCNYIMNNGQRTPLGLLWIISWGPLRGALDASLVCFEVARQGLNVDNYVSLGKSQVDYAMGDAGRSYIVGLGSNPPQHAHHRSSSCPDAPATCDWNTYNGDQPNAHVLYGAMVGGPDQNDQFTDSRGDWEHTEVGLDYNAAFQTCLAALIHFGY